jgi:hypothetical protein
MDQTWQCSAAKMDSLGHSASISAYQLSIPDGTKVTDQLAGTAYTINNGTIQRRRFAVVTNKIGAARLSIGPEEVDR